MGSTAVMNFTPHCLLTKEDSLAEAAEIPKAISIFLQPRSLLVFKDSAYESMLLTTFLVRVFLFLKFNRQFRPVFFNF